MMKRLLGVKVDEVYFRKLDLMVSRENERLKILGQENDVITKSITRADYIMRLIDLAYEQLDDLPIILEEDSSDEED